MAGEDFIKCFNTISYSAEDVIYYTSTDQQTYVAFDNFNTWLNIKRFFVDSKDGMALSVEIENGTVISNDIWSTFSFKMNSDLSYLIYIMDESLQFITGSPNIVPRSVLSWIRKGNGNNILYLKVIRHEKLNRPDRPCDPSPDYSWAKCLDRSLMTRAGCQPPWRRVSVENVPVCDNKTLLDSYETEYWNYYNMDKKRLFKETNCLMSCSFMEYKVSILSIINLLN